MDLGACPKSHTARYFWWSTRQTRAIPQRFQPEYESNIFAFNVDECDRRIRTAKRRLEKMPEENFTNAKITNLVRTLPLGFGLC